MRGVCPLQPVLCSWEPGYHRLTRIVSSCMFFFFSSRRRHTRSLCDWSSDVCSSDLNLSAIGIKLDIQNYGAQTFFGSFVPQGKPSPPTGAVAGRNDIAEFSVNPNKIGRASCRERV